MAGTVLMPGRGPMREVGGGDKGMGRYVRAHAGGGGVPQGSAGVHRGIVITEALKHEVAAKVSSGVPCERSCRGEPEEW